MNWGKTIGYDRTVNHPHCGRPNQARRLSSTSTTPALFFLTRLDPNPGTVKKLVELLPQRAAARESGQPGSANNWFLREYISRIQYCRRPYLKLHGFLIVPITIMLGNAEEKDVAFFVLERFAAGGRVEGFRKAFHSVPANGQGFICEGAHPNHGNVVPVAVVPLPHRLTPLEVLAVVKTHNIDSVLSSLYAALHVALHQELQDAAPLAPSGVVASHAVVQRERLRATPLTFLLRAEVAQLRTEVCMLTLKAKLLAGMRAAAVCLQPGGEHPLTTLKTRVHLPGPSIAGLAGVSWGVCQRPGEDEEVRKPYCRISPRFTVL
ncbi:hypothetical protein B0H14DRAFT_3603740 [Mycena olivaceomarginata]|nr:hypothetical protein B0H14DRAFT_3603740 [Mycena olivaceomarginata]